MKKMKLILATIALIGASSASAITITQLDSDIGTVGIQNFSGNDFTSTIDSDVTTAFGITEPTLKALKLDQGTSGTAGPVNELSVFSASTSGTWSFTTAADQQVVGYSLKSSNNFALFSVDADVGEDITDVVWDNGAAGLVNNMGMAQALSHFVVYYTSGNTGGPVTAPDAGSTLALMGSALAGLGLLKRRK